MKKILSFVLVLCLCLGLAACGGAGETEQTEGVKLGANEALYKVTVADPIGVPYTAGVIVRFMQNGEQVSMQVINEQGVAEKALAKGEYTVELQFTDKNAVYYYDASDVKLTAEQTEATVELSYGITGEGESIHAWSLVAQSQVDCQAYPVTQGCTYVELTKDERNYFMFTPTQAGTYKFYTLDGQGDVGYYGSPYFVQDTSAYDIVDGAVTASISASMIGTEGSGTTVMVIGVDAAADHAILVVERQGDAQHNIEDEPWTEYKTTHTPAPFSLGAGEGEKLTYVDITGKTEDYQLVMGSDGFYHLGTADGPVMYINFGKEAPNLSLEIMINGDGLAGGAAMRRYFFDESGNFIKKEDYTGIMCEYFACADEQYRVYPLTADLEYMIKNAGSWWDPESPNYIFDGCNPEIGWLFACCYIQ